MVCDVASTIWRVRGNDVTQSATSKQARGNEGASGVKKAPNAKELLARLRQFRGRLPKDFKFDRLEANERR